MLYSSISYLLKCKANAKRAIDQAKYMKNVVKVLGVSMPQIDECISKFVSSNDYTTSKLSVKLDLTFQLMESDYFEHKATGIRLLSKVLCIFLLKQLYFTV